MVCRVSFLLCLFLLLTTVHPSLSFKLVRSSNRTTRLPQKILPWIAKKWLTATAVPLVKLTTKVYFTIHPSKLAARNETALPPHPEAKMTTVRATFQSSSLIYLLGLNFPAMSVISRSLRNCWRANCVTWNQNARRYKDALVRISRWDQRLYLSLTWIPTSTCLCCRKFTVPDFAAVIISDVESCAVTKQMSRPSKM